MKKIFLVILSIICCFALFGCNKEEQHDILNPYFTGKVLELNEKGYLVEVVDSGNGCFSVGEKVQVNVPSTKFSVDDKIIISFDGKVALSIPPQISSVTNISKQN
ncbi:MAG: hypothetical protein E7348_01585 [Clostridiales bacterium]|nr:hypothetical protein [Clostridiales bacterium]